MTTMIKALLVTFLLLIPWTKLEIFPRITVAEIFFGLLAASLVIQLARSKIRVPALPLARAFVSVLCLWVLASLFSGLHARHLTSYLFEAGGVVYLSLLGLMIAFISGLHEENLGNALRWTVYSVILVIAVCVIGVVKGYVSGFGDLFFFNYVSKLIATFKNPNQLAAFLVLFLPVLWELLWTSEGKKRFGYGFLCLAGLLAILASGSRTGVAVTSIIIACYTIYYVASRQRKKALVLVSTVVVLIGVAFLLAGAPGTSEVWGSQDILSLFRRGVLAGQFTDSWRAENWSHALRLFRQFPITGYGLGNVWIDFTSEIHNTYLSVLAEMGIVGAVAILSLFGYIGFVAFRNIRLATYCRATWRPYARGLFAGLVGVYIFAIQHVIIRNRHLWVVFGLIMAMNVLLRRVERTKGARHVRNLRDTVS